MEPDTARDQLAGLRRDLTRTFVHREAVIDASLAALVCGQHVLLVGPPGTAKSQLAARLCASIGGARWFQWLLTRFTTPEELFGPVSLAALEADRYERLTDGKLPTAHVVFLDEVFKASSAILNTLLTLMNERMFHNGARTEPAPLVSLFGATNELPEEDELLALYDRFLVRVVVDYVEADHAFLRLLTLPPPGEPTAHLDVAALAAARAAAAEVEVEAARLTDVAALRRTLREKGVVASDRRWRHALDYLRARAWLDGRESVAPADLLALEHVLWSAPDERETVRAALRDMLSGDLDAIRELVFQARELYEAPARFAADPEAQQRAALEAYVKCGKLLEAAEASAARARSGVDRATALEIEASVREITRLRQELARTYLQEHVQ